MKKLKYLFFAMPLFLVACFTPPTPEVELTNPDTDLTTIIPLSNDAPWTYFRTALPFVASEVRGLVLPPLNNRADIEQAEMSLLRIAADTFNPEEYYFRDGQTLTADLVASVLQVYNPEIDNHRGLNPELGSELSFNGITLTSTAESPIRPLIYILEQNFVTFSEEDNSFHLEGAAIAIALNPYHHVIDRSIGYENEYRMSDDEIISIGQRIAANLLPHLRNQEGLEDVPIILGLFILRASNEVIPGHFASVTHIEEGRSSIDSWDSVHERHLRLPDNTNAIHVYDVEFNDQFNAFSNHINTHFPHQHSMVASAHIVAGNIYHIDITFNMNFRGAAEKIAFHQLLEEQVMTSFSPTYNIVITVRNPSTIHGVVTRPANGEAFVKMISQ